MIEERGRVLSMESGAVWVTTIRSSTCGSCQAKAGCGHALLQKLGTRSSQGFVRALTEQTWQIGEEVIIGVPENAVVRSAMWAYLVPLVGLFTAALTAQALGCSEPMMILLAAVGLLAGFAVVRWHDRKVQQDSQLHPQVIARASPSVVLVSAHQEDW